MLKYLAKRVALVFYYFIYRDYDCFLPSAADAHRGLF